MLLNLNKIYRIHPNEVVKDPVKLISHKLAYHRRLVLQDIIRDKIDVVTSKLTGSFTISYGNNPCFDILYEEQIPHNIL